MTQAKDKVVAPRPSLKEKLKNIGPGAIVTASFIGPGTVTTATRAGAGFEYAILWAVIFSIITTIVLQEMSMRIGIIANKDLGNAIHDLFTNKLMKFGSIWLVAISIGVGSAAYMSGDLLGTSMGISTLFDIPPHWVSPLIGVIILMIGLKGNYKTIERVMIVLIVLMSATFLTTMFVVKPNIGAVLQGALFPQLPTGSILLVIALIGTTVVPYNFFMHSSMVREKWHSPNDLRVARADTVISITVGGLITAAILITAGTVMYGHEVQSVADLSIQLEPLFGSWAKTFISIGIFAAGFSSALASPLGAALTIGSVFKWEGGMQNKRFKIIFASVIIIGIVTSALGFKPMDVLLLAQILNGILLPVIAIYLMIVMNNKKLLGEHRNGWFINIVGTIITGVCIFLGGYSILDAFGAF